MKNFIKAVLSIVVLSFIACLVLNLLNSRGYLDKAKNDFKDAYNEISDDVDDLNFKSIGGFRKSMEDKLGYENSLNTSVENLTNINKDYSIAKNRTYSLSPKVNYNSSEVYAKVKIPNKMKGGNYYGNK